MKNLEKLMGENIQNYKDNSEEYSGDVASW